MTLRNIFLCLTLVVITSCNMFSSLTSTTYIKPKQSFVLGDNEHGTASLRLKNISDNDLEVYMAPIAGGRHSSQIVKPGVTVKVSIDANTAVVISNATDKDAAVELLVKGDLGLSMGYK